MFSSAIASPKDRLLLGIPVHQVYWSQSQPWAGSHHAAPDLRRAAEPGLQLVSLVGIAVTKLKPARSYPAGKRPTLSGHDQAHLL